MKALSLWQPWASALFATHTTLGDKVRLKVNETRSWPTSYRGPLLIHASKHWDRLEAVGPDTVMAGWQDPCAGLIVVAGVTLQAMSCEDGDQSSTWRLPLGAALGVVDLVDCVQTESLYGKTTEWEWGMGNYHPGRHAWVTASPRLLRRPVACSGRQGLWDVGAELLAEMRAAGLPDGVA